MRGLKPDKSGSRELFAEARGGDLQALARKGVTFIRELSGALGPIHAPTRGLLVFVNQKPILKMLAISNQVVVEGNFSWWGVSTAQAEERTEQVIDVLHSRGHSGPRMAHGVSSSHEDGQQTPQAP